MHVIEVDSREKKNGHILTDLEMSDDIKVLKTKLAFGDYRNLSSDPFLVVERKNSMLEICTCCGSQIARFSKELKTAKTYGFHIVVLIESDECSSLDDIKDWINPYANKAKHALTGIQIWKILNRFVEYYNIEVRFTTKDMAGIDIMKILGVIDD